MIKFPSKHATLYGFSMIAYGLIMGNIIFLTKVLNINNKKKLAYLIFISFFSAHDKKIKKSDKTRHNSNFFDELNHAKSYQT